LIQLKRSLVASLLVSLLVSAMLLMHTGCRRANESFVIVLDANPETLDPLRGTDASSERLRVLLFDSLVRKNERFEYVGHLAEHVQTADDGLSVTFTLRDGVTFHNGQTLTAADAKYTLDTVLSSDSRKNASFFEEVPSAGRQSRVQSVEAPDARTLVVRLRKPWFELLANMVAIGIVPQNSDGTHKSQPIGSGPYRFVRFDESQQIVDLEAYENYWQGAANIKQIRCRAILDANTLQAELVSGRVGLAANPLTLTPDTYRAMGNNPNLKVEQFPGANIVYLGFNVQSAPLNDARVRQAIAYALDREGVIRDLLSGQARIAHSVLPEELWAYAAGQKYSYDPGRAKQLLDEAGLRDPDGDGPQMRIPKPINFKVSSSNATARQYAGVMQNALKAVGLPVEIETLETVSLLAQLRNGQFQMTAGSWVGGNQDPIFLRDLFATSEIPTQQRAGRNRSRYSNRELDRILTEAVTTHPDRDREKALSLYATAQQIVSRDLPMLPLWYPANMAVARSNVDNIKIDASGDWGFVRSLKIE